ncbi:pre-mRNA-splicing regulator female-lethal(2)D [Malaya genurostris]|uniref:pre-mRNA-splicing regulator female-lethal(2)D n=1 Tax=Malaya genurostris TaxID=325434 RepID=UPI0026F40339|nr:pre-mRNA-splicing regulator female-lethal(2)D [Malaya genurostris]XP_058456463.1 pre-mRNA-splicing regulator female-lethal(2)D [Malaya genurostris]
MQSAEDTSNLMDTDRNASLCASSPPLNCAAPTAPAGTIGSGAIAGAVPTGRTVESLEYHCRMLEEELQTIKDSEGKLKLQYAESQRRERILARRLAVKEQEMQDFASQIAELKTAQAPGQAALRSALLDPAVNILFQKLKCELQQTKAKLEETQNELSAWKFTPDSNTGKRLMAKCRLLYQENEELGKMTSNGRLAKLEGELALQKSYNEEVKKSQLELDDFLQEMDEDVEGMQSTIVFLQQELKSTKEEKELLEKEVVQLRTYVNGGGSVEDGSSQMEMDADPSDSVYLVNGNNKLMQSSSDQSESLLVYQNRTHCGGNNSNPGLLQNGGDELVNEQDQTIGNVSGGSNNSSSRLSGNSNTSTGSNNKKVNNNRTAKTVGGKKRNYTDEQDDEGAAGSDDEGDSGHYDEGSNNGKMLAPDSLELQQQQQQQHEEEQIIVSSNKRMTRSGKGKAPPKTLSVKKLRRASVLSSEPTEDDDTAEGFPANGSN